MLFVSKGKILYIYWWLAALDMAGELEIIDELIAQNRIVRLNLRSMKGAMSDSEALFSVEEARSKWAQPLAKSY